MPVDARFFLKREDAFVLIVDIQEKLASAMSERGKVVENNLHLIELAKLQETPIIVTEQYSKGLGATVPELQDALPDYWPIEKISFNCCSTQDFAGSLSRSDRKTAIITGMETHICVLQTTLGLLDQGYKVHVVSDAVCSRTKSNWRNGLELMRDAGAVITSTETVLFQLLGVAGTEEFKIISKRIK